MFRSIAVRSVTVVLIAVFAVAVPEDIVRADWVPAGFPDASSTGPTNESLVPASASGFVSTSYDGQVLENFHANSLLIVHDDVTVRNFRITRSNREQWYAIAIQKHAESGESVKGTVFEDGEIITRDSAGNPLPSRGTGINGGNFEARRLEISYIENGFACSKCVLEDNYIHDLLPYNDTHNDGVALTQGVNVTIRGNTISLPDQQTSAVILGTYSGAIDNVLIEDNYLNGGAYTLYSRDNGNGHGAPTNVVVRRNAFGRDHLFGILSSDSGDLVWQDNYWANTREFIDEDGQTIGGGVQFCNGLEATVTGTLGNDTLQGTAGRDVIAGLGGDDVIDGLGGDDVICGHSGRDTLIGGSGNDVIFGGRSRDTVDGGEGADKLRGGLHADVVRGGAGNDFLLGGSHRDKLFGDAGDDRIKGERNDDALFGGPGNDDISGNYGDDKLNGGGGTDALNGGVGIDSCENGEAVTRCE